MNLVDRETRFDVYKIKWGDNISPELCESMTFDKFSQRVNRVFM